ncbi:hypothetical protein GCM10023238_10520 [Streptomyces heliomycini]
MGLAVDEGVHPALREVEGADGLHQGLADGPATAVQPADLRIGVDLLLFLGPETSTKANTLAPCGSASSERAIAGQRALVTGEQMPVGVRVGA